jgi:hypothetical protein
MHQGTRPHFFIAAMGMVPFLLLYTFSFTFLLSKVSVAMSFAIGIVLALAIMALALISRYRQEPPRRRALGLISIMILYQAIMVVGWIVISDR